MLTISQQSLTSAQKTQVMSNIGAASQASVSALSDRIGNNNRGTTVSLSQNQTYTCPSDGYVAICNNKAQIGYCTITGANNLQFGSLRPITPYDDSNAQAVCFVRKGMKIVVGGASFNFCEFNPIT